MLLRLGPRRLAYVKLIQALLNVNNAEIDEQIQNFSIIRIVVGLMFEFQRHSVLHLSAHRIILMLIEEFDRRGNLFMSLISEACLLDRIMEFVRATQSGPKNAHYPLLGHIYVIGHVLVYGLNSAASKGQLEDFDASSAEVYVWKFRDTVKKYVDLTAWDDFVETVFRAAIKKNQIPNSNPLDSSMMSDKTNDFESSSKDHDFESDTYDLSDSASSNLYKTQDHFHDVETHMGGQAFEEDLFAHFVDAKTFPESGVNVDVSHDSHMHAHGASSALAADFDPFGSSSVSFDSSNQTNGEGNSNNSASDPFASTGSFSF